jgi:hypothetical protein
MVFGANNKRISLHQLIRSTNHRIMPLEKGSLIPKNVRGCYKFPSEIANPHTINSANDLKRKCGQIYISTKNLIDNPLLLHSVTMKPKDCLDTCCPTPVRTPLTHGLHVTQTETDFTYLRAELADWAAPDTSEAIRDRQRQSKRQRRGGSACNSSLPHCRQPPPQMTCTCEPLSPFTATTWMLFFPEAALATNVMPWPLAIFRVSAKPAAVDLAL